MHHDELILCARHRNIQHAQLFGLGFSAQRTLKCLTRDRRVLNVSPRVHAHRPQPELRMHQHRALEVHVAEAPRKVGEDHDREFQSF